MSSAAGRSYPFIDAHTHWRAGTNPSAGSTISLYSFTPGDKIDPAVKYFSAAYHPAQADSFSEEMLLELLEDPRCAAVGECGLDPFSPVPMEVQEQVFLRQMDLAQAVEKPLVIHCVRNFPRILSLRKKFWKKKHIPFLIHSFRGKKELAEQLLQHNCLLSLSPVWLCRQEKLDPVFQSASILLETDMDTDHTPEDLYERMAHLCKTSVEQLCEKMFHTFSRFFPSK